MHKRAYYDALGIARPGRPPRHIAEKKLKDEEEKQKINLRAVVENLNRMLKKP